MKAAPFAYRQADTLGEALDTLAEFGDEVTLLAGGQSLVPLLATRRLRPQMVLDITRIDSLARVQSQELGAMVRQCDAAPIHPLLDKVLPFVGHRQTRHRGTIGGSLAFGDPLAEIPLALLVADGTIHVESSGQRRSVRAEDFFDRAFTPRLASTEMVVSSRWPEIPPGAGVAFDEVADGVTLGAAAALVSPVTSTQRRAVVGVAGTRGRPRRFEATIGSDCPTDELRSVVADALADFDFEEDDQVESAFRRALVTELAVRVLRAGLITANDGGTS